MNLPQITRRRFVRLGAATAAGAAIQSAVLKPAVLFAQVTQSGRKIRFVSIGTGFRGCNMANSSYFHRASATWDPAAQTIKG